MSYWIIANDNPAHPHFYYFKKEFIAPEGTTFSAKICADTRYRLYLNGKTVSEGPCSGSEYLTYYEEEDLSRYLNIGKNTLIAKVLFATDGYMNSFYRKENPGFWFDGELIFEEERIKIGTDSTWSCEREDACSFFCFPGLHKSIPPFEEWRGKSSATPIDVISLYEPDIDNKCINKFGIIEKYPLTPRTIPQMESEPPIKMKPIRSGDGFMEFDAEKYTTSHLLFSFKAPKGSKIKIIYAECYTAQAHDEGFKNLRKEIRDDHTSPGATLFGAYDTLIATGEEQTFSPFWYRSFRFIKIEYENDLELRELSYMKYHYPLDISGEFECSDPRLNQMWDVSCNTVLCCMHELYIDCPYYEQQQYQMDSALEMLFTLRMSSDARLPKKSILELAHSQMANGMLQAHYPDAASKQIIPNFTLFWVLMLRDYLRYTNDKKTVRELAGTMDKAFEAFTPYIDETGLIGPMPYWNFIDWVPSWPFGVPPRGDKEPLTVTSLMYASALKAGAEIAVSSGRDTLALEYSQRAQKIINSVKAHCYDEKTGLFRDTPGSEKFSQHTALWAILSGAVIGEAAGQLVERIFDRNADIEQCTFSMSHYLFRALELAGKYEYAEQLLSGWQKMLELHCTTWCENPDSPRSECHGWSSTPIYEFSEMILGAYPTENGYDSVRIKPFIDGFGLRYAKGSIPTPKGNILISWVKEGGMLELDVTLPRNDIKATVILPDGSETEQAEDHMKYTCVIN